MFRLGIAHQRIKCAESRVRVAVAVLDERDDFLHRAPAAEDQRNIAHDVRLLRAEGFHEVIPMRRLRDLAETFQRPAHPAHDVLARVCVSALERGGEQRVHRSGRPFDFLGEPPRHEPSHSGNLRRHRERDRLIGVRGDRGLDAIPNHKRLLPIVRILRVRGECNGKGEARIERQPLHRARRVKPHEAVAAVGIGELRQLRLQGLRTAVCADARDHAWPPVVARMRCRFLRERSVVHLREIKCARRLVLPVNNFVNPPARPVHAVAVVTLTCVAPINHKHTAIRPRAEIEPAEPFVFRLHEIRTVLRHEAVAFALEDVRVDAVPVQVAREKPARVFLRPRTAIVDHAAHVRVAAAEFVRLAAHALLDIGPLFLALIEVIVVRRLRDGLIDVRVQVRAKHPVVIRAGDAVE